MAACHWFNSQKSLCPEGFPFQSSPNNATALTSLKEDHTDLINQFDFIQLVMGLTSKKIDVSICLTSLIYYGAKPAVSFQPTDLEKATQSVDQLIHSISSVPHFR